MADVPQHQSPMHEAADISPRAVLWGGIAIAVGIVLAAIAAFLLWQHWDAPSGAQPFGGPNTGRVPQVAPPALESAPQQARRQYFTQQDKRLQSWEWIDRGAGIARIPLDEAMRIMVARDAENNASSGKEQP